MSEEPVECPECGGRGTYAAFVDGHRPDGTAWGEFRPAMKCTFCGGSGIVSAFQVEWLEVGQAYRRARVARLEPIHEAASRLRVSPAQLSAMEHGRMDPAPLRSLAQTPDTPTP